MMAPFFSDDEPNITREVVMSCLYHSLGYIDWKVLSQQFEGYDEKGCELVFCSLRGISYFNYDSPEVQLLIDELREIENGFCIFYNCLRVTQDRCHGHQILADDLELESRSKIIMRVATQFNHFVA